MLRAFSAFCLLSFLAGCASKPPLAPREVWTPEKVIGLVIELEDPADEERLQFLADHSVLASFTVDQRKYRYRETFQWFIRSGRLLIHSDTEIYDELELISRTPSQLSVRKRSREIAIYRIITQNI